jgi:hypothetical protein
MAGLNHRFNKDDTFEWLFWQRCLWCGENRWDALHHVISPSSYGYQQLDCNESILNSCPIHNRACHLDNSQLHKRDNEVELLEKIILILSNNDYKLKEIDKNFIKAYYDSHYKHINIPQCYTSGLIQVLPEAFAPSTKPEN